MKYIFTFLCLILLFKISPSSQIIEQEIKIDIINQKILDLSDSCGLNTPIGTSVKFYYALAKGKNSEIIGMSSPKVKDYISRSDKINNKEDNYLNSPILNSIILYTINYRDSVASIVREEGNSIFMHHLSRQNGKWMHEGEGFGNSSIEKTKEIFLKHLPSSLNSLQKIEILNTVSTDTMAFANYLKEKAMPPKEFILKQLSKHKLIIYGELHRRKVSWDMMQSVITSSEFDKYIGTVFLELSVDGQEYIDRFFKSKKKDPEIILNMLRNEDLSGWNDKGMYEFILKLWDINKKLPPERKIKVITVDSSRPFYKEGVSIIDDYADYNRNRANYRNNYMADKIEQYIKLSQDKRNTLFIVGYDHAWKSQADIQGSNSKNPDKRTSGAILADKSPANSVFSIFTHCPIITNVGGAVSGLTRNGLFDNVFAQADNKPIAFVLKDSPFGREPFDVTESRFNLKLGNYEDCFDGYIFLEPLEQEKSDYWLPELYTEKFIKEIKKRASIIGRENYILFGGVPIKDISYEDVMADMKRNKSKSRFQIHPLK